PLRCRRANECRGSFLRQYAIVLDLIRPYFEQWGYLIVFAICLLENSAFVGAIVPGDVVLLLAGFYVQRSRLNLAPVVALAFAGAVTGDTIGYFIGRT